MAGRSWEEQYEADQSRLRDAAPRCQGRTADGSRCPNRGKYASNGYFPDLIRGCLCSQHRQEEEKKIG